MKLMSRPKPDLTCQLAAARNIIDALMDENIRFRLHIDLLNAECNKLTEILCRQVKLGDPGNIVVISDGL